MSAASATWICSDWTSLAAAVSLLNLGAPSTGPGVVTWPCAGEQVEHGSVTLLALCRPSHLDGPGEPKAAPSPMQQLGNGIGADAEVSARLGQRMSVRVDESERDPLALR